MIYRNAEKAAKVVKDQPKMITIMQHLDDPIQKGWQKLSVST